MHIRSLYLKKLTQRQLKKLLNYDPKTGIFRWRVNKARCAQIDSIAGRRGNIMIDGTGYHAHRLAFLWMTGHWPKYDIDHKNGNFRDNRWTNLREATPSQNLMNARTQKTGKFTSPYKGVSRCSDRPGKWQARICIHPGGFLGRFDTPEEAHAAYCKAARKHFGEFARTD
jgi:Demerecviridae HNH endonuclease